MNPTVKEQLQHAKDLIRQQRYDEARAILVFVDHPKAQEWLHNLEQIAPSEPFQKLPDRKKSGTARRLRRLGVIWLAYTGVSLLALAVCGLALWLTLPDDLTTLLPNDPIVYDHPALTLEYPGSWYAMNQTEIGDIEDCGGGTLECIGLFVPPTIRQHTLIIYEIAIPASLFELSTSELERELYRSIREAYENEEFIARDLETFGAYEAVWREMLYPARVNDGDAYEYTAFVRQGRHAYLFVYTAETRAGLDQFRPDVEAMLRTLQIK